ncbi:MAG TPA: ABC transporter ATP-binding protein [Acidimicrobiales bacterium]
MTPAVRAAGLGVSRGGTRVLRDVTFDLVPGDVTGLLGPSGSGKTTLMRAVVGVQRNVSGTLDVLGRPAGAPDLRRRVGYVTQAPAVYNDLTVEENLRYFARAVGADGDAPGRAIATVHLDDHADRPVASLSSGQVSRVSLATALLGSPDLLLLDEPTVGLDPVLRAELWATFHDLARTGVALLVSSHVMDEADRCDRILVLREGRLLMDDTPAGMRRRTGEDRLDEAFLALVRERAS